MDTKKAIEFIEKQKKTSELFIEKTKHNHIYDDCISEEAKVKLIEDWNNVIMCLQSLNSQEVR